MGRVRERGYGPPGSRRNVYERQPGVRKMPVGYGVVGEQLSIKFGIFTRDMLAVSGLVSYTGIGFKPRLVIFVGGVVNTTKMSLFGAMDGDQEFNIHNRSAFVADSQGLT